MKDRAMTNSRVQTLFATLDAQLSPEILEILDRQDLIYSFTFKADNDAAGKLAVYRPQTHNLNATQVNADTDWFHHSRVWFRKSATRHEMRGEKYEAFIAFLHEYRDDITVHLDDPIMILELPNLNGAKVKDAEQLLAKYRLQPIPEPQLF